MPKNGLASSSQSNIIESDEDGDNTDTELPRTLPTSSLLEELERIKETLEGLEERMDKLEKKLVIGKSARAAAHAR